MQAIDSKDNKKFLNKPFLIFLKFYAAIFWRSLFVICLFTFVFILINIIIYKERFLCIIDSVGSHFVHSVFFLISIPLNSYALKLATLKSYKTFRVIWRGKAPESIFNKKLLCPALILTIAGCWPVEIIKLVVDKLWDCNINFYLELFTGYFLQFIALYIFINKRWFELHYGRVFHLPDNEG